MSLKKLLLATAFILIAATIGIAGYLYFMKQQPALAQMAGENIYISQSGNGSQNGSDCNNSRYVSWFNVAGNWANPKQAGKIGPGDTVHFCGTITTNVSIKGGGTVGNVITFLFESGAKFSKSHWNTSGGALVLADSAISGYGISYIVIDGGSNGLIEATDNGTNLTYQLWNGGFTCSNCGNVEVKNLSVLNIYQRVNGFDANGSGGAVQFRNGASNIKIHNNTLRQVYAPVFIQAAHASGDANIEIYNNIISDAGQGEVIIAVDTIQATLTNVLIHDNLMDKGNLTWDGDPATHTNCIHTYAMATGTRLDGLKIYNNTFTGAWGIDSTSYVFIEGYTYTPLIYNNLFIAGTTGSGGNGYLFFKGADNSIAANNTFIGYGVDGGGTGIFYGGYGAGDVNNKAYNNLFYNISLPIASPYDLVTLVDSDYNVFYSHAVGYPKFNFGSYAQRDFSNWKSYTGFDAHSTIDNPQINSNYRLTNSTPASVKGAGINLYTYFTTDKNGTPRPQGSAWDIGAYEYATSTPPPPPPLKGDFNSDQKVNDLDFASFKNAFKSLFNSLFDLNSDNTIDVKDLGVLMSSWLP